VQERVGGGGGRIEGRPQRRPRGRRSTPTGMASGVRLWSGTGRGAPTSPAQLREGVGRHRRPHALLAPDVWLQEGRVLLGGRGGGGGVTPHQRAIEQRGMDFQMDSNGRKVQPDHRIMMSVFWGSEGGPRLAIRCPIRVEPGAPPIALARVMLPSLPAVGTGQATWMCWKEGLLGFRLLAFGDTRCRRGAHSWQFSSIRAGACGKYLPASVAKRESALCTCTNHVPALEA
jgi:hypothetical protein